MTSLCDQEIITPDENERKVIIHGSHYGKRICILERYKELEENTIGIFFERICRKIYKKF